MMSDSVLYQKDGPIGRITLNRPEKRNALDPDMLQSLIDCFVLSKKNEDLCVIYGANGKEFTVGADLKFGYQMMTDPGLADDAMKYFGNFQELCRVMLDHDGIIISGLHGWVIGGGFEIHLACDLRAAAKDTTIMLPELSMGLMFSNASTKLLSRIVGEGRAKELLFLGEKIDAQKAYDYGLIFHIAEDIDALNQFLDETATAIVQKSSFAIRFAKKLVHDNQDADISSVLDREMEGMIATGQSEECIQRITAFVQKKR
jgi:enoyl-CoA hydratase/carnithine racemase